MRVAASWNMVVGRVIEEVTLELEVDNEVHMSPLARRRERPRVRQVLQRSPFRRAHQHLPRSIQRDLARKAFLERAEPDLVLIRCSAWRAQ